MFVNAEYGGNSIDAEETLLPIDVLWQQLHFWKLLTCPRLPQIYLAFNSFS